MIANGWKLIVRGLVATTYWVRDCSALAVEQEGAVYLNVGSRSFYW